jgi:hypothetical protein
MRIYLINKFVQYIESLYLRIEVILSHNLLTVETAIQLSLCLDTLLWRYIVFLVYILDRSIIKDAIPSLFLRISLDLLHWLSDSHWWLLKYWFFRCFLLLFGLFLTGNIRLLFNENVLILMENDSFHYLIGLWKNRWILFHRTILF